MHIQWNLLIWNSWVYALIYSGYEWLRNILNTNFLQDPYNHSSAYDHETYDVWTLWCESDSILIYISRAARCSVHIYCTDATHSGSLLSCMVSAVRIRDSWITFSCVWYSVCIIHARTDSYYHVCLYLLPQPSIVSSEVMSCIAVTVMELISTPQFLHSCAFYDFTVNVPNLGSGHWWWDGQATAKNKTWTLWSHVVSHWQAGVRWETEFLPAHACVHNLPHIMYYFIILWICEVFMFLPMVS